MNVDVIDTKGPYAMTTETETRTLLHLEVCIIYLQHERMNLK